MNEGFNIRRVSESPPGEAISALFWGGSGTGKTHLCGTAGDRALIILADPGEETLKSPLFKKLVGSNPFIVDIWEKAPKSGVIEVPQAFDMICDIIDHGINHMKSDIDTIIVDGTSRMNRYAMNKAYQVNKELKRSQTLDDAKGKKIRPLPQQQDFNTVMEIVDQFIGDHVALCKRNGLHFIMTAHERNYYRKLNPKDPQSELTLVKSVPGFLGSAFPDQVPGHFDWVWKTQVTGSGEKTFYSVLTKGGESIKLKTRHGGVFDEKEKNPNFLQLIQKLKLAYKKNAVHSTVDDLTKGK